MHASVIYDAAILGGGPAGLSAALVLGRARRNVIVIDSGEYRNERSQGLHGFLSRDGILPGDLLKIGRTEIATYGVEFRRDLVKRVTRDARGFRLLMQDRRIVRSRLLLLATGVVDRLPVIDNIDAFYGKSVHHCPYCDGWEWRDHPIAIVGHGKSGIALTMKMLNWSTDLVLCTHGPARYSFDELSVLRERRIRLITSRIDRLAGEAGFLQRIYFRDGTSLDRDAIFFTAPQDQRCTLAHDLGCELTTQHVVRTTRHQETNVPGLYVAGDAARDVHFAIVAAAEGAKAAVFMDEALSRIVR